MNNIKIRRLILGIILIILQLIACFGSGNWNFYISFASFEAFIYSFGFFVGYWLCGIIGIIIILVTILSNPMKDVRAFEKEAASKGMTPGGYASITFPPSYLDMLEANKDDKQEFNRILKQGIEGEVISKSDANVLRYMFRRGK